MFVNSHRSCISAASLLALSLTSSAAAEFDPPVALDDAGDFPNVVATGFVDDDQLPDVVVVPAGSEIRVYLGTGLPEQRFLGPIITPTELPVGGNAAALGDINNDGMTDIAIATGIANSVHFLLGDGVGRFPTESDSYHVPHRTSGVVFANLNGDADRLRLGDKPWKLDVAFGSDLASDLNLMLGDGNGKMTHHATLSGYDSPIPPRAGDVDCDGAVDLAFLSRYSDQDFVVRYGDGSGGFDTEAVAATGFGQVTMQLGDVDNDGFLDGVVSNNTSSTLSVLLGNRAREFTSADPIPWNGRPYLYWTDLGDFNCDGNLDVVASDLVSGEVVIYHGVGTGEFAEAEVLAVARPSTGAVMDIDRDGADDLIVSQELTDSEVLVFRNASPACFAKGFPVAPCEGLGRPVDAYLFAGGTTSTSSPSALKRLKDELGSEYLGTGDWRIVFAPRSWQVETGPREVARGAAQRADRRGADLLLVGHSTGGDFAQRVARILVEHHGFGNRLTLVTIDPEGTSPPFKLDMRHSPLAARGSVRHLHFIQPDLFFGRKIDYCSQTVRVELNPATLHTRMDDEAVDSPQLRAFLRRELNVCAP